MTPNPYRDKNFRTVLAARKYLASCGAELKICLPFDVDRTLMLPSEIEFSDLSRELPGADLLICFGGDGTILHASKAAANARVPILGVNIGTLGFMAELESSELPLLEKIAQGCYTLERRSMLQAAVIREGETILREIALNDVVVTKGAVARELHLSVYCDRMEAMEFGGDGVIIATPTGSTAYSLSAGGPVIEPGAKNFLITPICAHDVKTRCIVTSDQRKITIQIDKAGRKNAFVSVDGGRALRLNNGDIVTVTRAEQETLLVRIKERSIYDIINNKFNNR